MTRSVVLELFLVHAFTQCFNQPETAEKARRKHSAGIERKRLGSVQQVTTNIQFIIQCTGKK